MMKITRSFLCFLLILAMTLPLYGCANSGAKEEGAITLYFTNEDFTRLYTSKTDHTEIDAWKDEASYVENLLDRMEVPEEYTAIEDEKAKLTSVIPEGLIQKIDIKTIYSERLDVGEEPSILRVVRIFLSDAYPTLKPNVWACFRTGVSQMLFSTGVFDQLEFILASDPDEKAVDRVYQKDRFTINAYTEEFYDEEVRVVLYFMNDEKTALVPEVRKLKLGFSEPLTEAVVKALIDGPKEEGHEASIPTGTQINKILLEDGVCYVDLSQEFQLNHEGGELLEKLTIYSIVNSLQNVSGVVYVQFLIDGARVDTYKAYMPLNHFLSPDTNLLEGEKTD